MAGHEAAMKKVTIEGIFASEASSGVLVILVEELSPLSIVERYLLFLARLTADVAD